MLIRNNRSRNWLAAAALGACVLAATAAHAQVATFEIPEGDLKTALEKYGAQSGVQLIYRTDEVQGVQTKGVRGQLSADEALVRLLQQTGFVVNRDTSGAIIIVRGKEPQAAAGAADTAVTLDEVIVTATRREEKLKDVPVAVSAITSTEIAARGFTQYADYLNSVPGVYFQDAGPGRGQIRIRGLSTLEGGVPSTVASYFGETVTSVITGQGGKPNMRLVDIDRIEVLRGPQGTLFGANALAGVVRTIPAQADVSGFDAKVGTRGFVTAHSDDASYHVEGMVNMPLVEDRLALRLVGYQDDIAGYVDNVFEGRDAIDYTELGEFILGVPPGTLPPGTLVSPALAAVRAKDVASEDTWGARAALAWQATDRLRFDLMLATQDTELDGEPHVLEPAGNYQQSSGTGTFERGRFSEAMDIASLTLRYDWESVSLIAATSWLEFARNDSVDFSAFALGLGLPPLPWTLRSPSDNEQFTQEVRLQSSGSGPLKWIVGAFYLDQQANFAQLLPDYSCPQCLPELLAGEDFVFSAVGHPFFKEEQTAVFGEITYDLSPRWTVGAGARYFDGEVTSLTPAFGGFLGAGSEQDTTSNSSEELNPSFHLRYRPTEELTMYLQAARGFRSGRANAPLPSACLEEAAAAGISPITDPDRLWNYEIGAKSSFADGRLSINAALYRADWQGVQIDATFECGFSSSINGGDARGEGVELELVAQLGNAWRLNLAAAYNYNEFTDVRPQTGFENGQTIPGSAEENGSIGLQYNFDLGSTWSGFARGDYVYIGDIPVSFAATTLVQEGFGTGNLRLGLQRDRLAVELFCRNLADERGVTATGEQGQLVLVRPREIGIELRYRLQ